MKDKVVLITGGSSGIGKALSEVFGKAGARIAITGRNQEKLDEQADRLAKMGIECLSIQADSADEQDNYRTVSETINKYGQIDILIANAGISMRAMFEDLDMKVFEKVMNINLYGPVYLTKAALPYLKRSKGSIIGISSFNGFKGTPARTAYTASKFALGGFLEALRIELFNSDVHVMTVYPGFTESNIRNTALTASGDQQGKSPYEEGKMMSSEEVASRIFKATKKKKRELYMGFETKMGKFLNKFFPKLTDRMVYNHMKKEEGSPVK
ncbi:SDR family oxidoreductase [Marinigracilibium pacificum]|uniref:SDR family oxidoreductase n=1 Tax=Marinigracilibium pacificum TaxID=2729599 RepID=A0A848IZV7_9BACT|nr:SDR family oxidoreductase [Marinigracilibium pacificum]NMM48921.1 SDR family oxidoreductase [Marinigracilibium pacificum]